MEHREGAPNGDLLPNPGVDLRIEDTFSVPPTLRAV